MLQCHVSVQGCKQTPMHVLLPAWGSTLQTAMLPAPIARVGLPLANQIQMNDFKLPADDAQVFPNLDLYLGDFL